MQSLFIHPAPKRGRFFLMLGASLLAHGGIIGIAALWEAPQPPVEGVIITTIFDGPTGGPTPLPPVFEIPTVNSSPIPPFDEPPVPTVPTIDSDPEFAETTPTPPSRKPFVAKPATTPRVARPLTGAGPVSNRSNGIRPGNTSTGPAASVNAWVMPHPPYPYLSSGSRPTGSTTVRISTDASGQVSNVVIVKSAGNPLLDHQTQVYVRQNWHGPPNASRTTEFVYQLR